MSAGCSPPVSSTEVSGFQASLFESFNQQTRWFLTYLPIPWIRLLTGPTWVILQLLFQFVQLASTPLPTLHAAVCSDIPLKPAIANFEVQLTPFLQDVTVPSLAVQSPHSWHDPVWHSGTTHCLARSFRKWGKPPPLRELPNREALVYHLHTYTTNTHIKSSKAVWIIWFYPN